jgi:thioredoxin reductase (NADPH)
MPDRTYDLIVIGEGISGLACAGHAARAGLRVATFESTLFGGLVINVAELDGYPEGGHGSGTDLASALMQSNSDAGVKSVQEEVRSVRAGSGAFEIASEAGRHQARSVVIASGARLRKLGVPGETEFEGRGVSSCADCDGPLFQNEDVVVVGGGDSALQEALVLAQYCRSVKIVLRGDELRARQHLAERARGNPRIAIVRKTTLEAIIGGKMVEKVRVRHAGGGSEDIPCAGVFAYIGLEPSAGFAPPEIARDARGHLVANASCETPVPGIWAIGAVRAGYRGLLRDAACEAQEVAGRIAERLALD